MRSIIDIIDVIGTTPYIDLLTDGLVVVGVYASPADLNSAFLAFPSNAAFEAGEFYPL